MRIRNNKGDLNGALACFIIMMVLAVVSVSLSLAKTQWQRFVVSNQLSFVGKVVGRQGGLRATKPSDFEKDLTYNTSSEVISMVQDAMEKAQIEDYEISVGGVKLVPGGSTSEYDFQEPITVSIKATFSNSFIGYKLGGPEKLTVTDNMVVLSEKYIRRETTIG